MASRRQSRLRGERAGYNLGVVRASHRYRGSFRCLPASVRRVRSEVRAFALPWLLEQDASDLESAIGEALANLVQHARASRFTVTCFVDRENLLAELHGDGPGFLKPASVSKPPAGAIRGYGLFIMHELLDTIEFFDEGRGVRFIKRRTRSRGK